jgi:hypothetical protein
LFTANAPGALAAVSNVSMMRLVLVSITLMTPVSMSAM